MKRSLVLVLVAGCFSKPPAPERTDPGVDAMTDSSGGPPGDVSTATVNTAFVTSAAFGANQLLTKEAADSRCNTLAQAAALPGTYVAWISFSGVVDAIDRLSGSRGWVRLDGSPFADTTSDIAAGITFSPLRIDELGQDASVSGDPVLTGTSAQGRATGQDCVSGSNVTTGLCDAAMPSLTASNSASCTNTLRLYCFGVGGVQPTKPPPMPSGGKRAFVSAATVLPGGVTTLDDRCAAEAATQGLTGQFMAFIATSAFSAVTRIAPTNTGQVWYRMDDTPLYIYGATQFLAPLDVLASGTHLTDTMPAFFGASGPLIKAVVADNCNDWVAAAGTTTIVANPRRSTNNAFKGGSSNTVSCTGTGHLYCFEQ